MYFAETSDTAWFEVFGSLFSDVVISPGVFPLFRTAMPMENACMSLMDELNSTEKIPSLNGDKMKKGRFSPYSSCTMHETGLNRCYSRIFIKNKFRLRKKWLICMMQIPRRKA